MFFPKNDSGKETVIGEIFAINNYLCKKEGNHSNMIIIFLSLYFLQRNYFEGAFYRLCSDSKGYIYSVNNIIYSFCF